MPLTRDFRETIVARAKSDQAFRSELIIEATNAFLAGEIETGKALLRDYLNGTESLTDIARRMQINEKSLRRMLGPKGNPTLKNFVGILKGLGCLEK